MAKERISLTIDGDLLEHVDRVLERRGISNRSRGVEELLQERLKRESVGTALVLAGGADSDCLININGRPVIAHALDHLAEEGVEQVFVATGSDDVEAALEGEWGFDLEFVREEEPLGTAGSLREIAEEVDETFAVLNGDVLADVDLADMRAAHAETDALATIALTTVEDASRYGVVRMKGNSVTGFEEKPEESYSHLINAGIYLMEPEIIERIPAREEKQQVDIEEIFERLAGEGRLNGYVYDGEWREVG